MTRIVLVRHGQTEWNRVERFRGREDLDLNRTGVRQAEATAIRVARWQASTIYSSPLKRALRTAAILASPLGLSATPLDGLLDIDYGSWQGLSPQEVSQRYPDLYSQWLQSPHLVHFPQGESLEEVRGRAGATLERASLEHPEETVILVSHQVVCKVILCLALGLDNSHFWQIRQDVGTINLLGLGDGSPVVTLLNDTCHLRHLDS